MLSESLRNCDININAHISVNTGANNGAMVGSATVNDIIPPLTGEIKPDDQQQTSEGSDRSAKADPHDPHPKDRAKQDTCRNPECHGGEDGVDQ